MYDFQNLDKFQEHEYFSVYVIYIFLKLIYSKTSVKRNFCLDV